VKRLLITGYSGFVGNGVADKLKNNYHLNLLGRKLSNLGTTYIRNLDAISSYSDALESVDVVIHCAARVHIMDDTASDPLAQFMAVNTEGTLNLAKQAVVAGVKRFIFLSSIKVNGEATGDKPFVESMVNYDNADPYSLSKWRAEQGLLKLAKNTCMEVVIVRPPLVYGPNVKGNFSSIVQLVNRQVPLPLKLVTGNKRSLVALDNLVDFILLCADYKNTPQAANQTFVISDGEDVSTAELFRRVASAYGKKSRLFSFLPSLLRLGAKLLGKQDVADRLTGSLQVDSSKARALLGWKPVITMDEQLRKMAEADSGER